MMRSAEIHYRYYSNVKSFSAPEAERHESGSCLSLHIGELRNRSTLYLDRMETAALRDMLSSALEDWQ